MYRYTKPEAKLDHAQKLNWIQHEFWSQETIWCDQLECLVKQRPEEDELIQNWRPFWAVEVAGNHKSSRTINSMKANNFDVEGLESLAERT